MSKIEIVLTSSFIAGNVEGEECGSIFEMGERATENHI